MLLAGSGSNKMRNKKGHRGEGLAAAKFSQNFRKALGQLNEVPRLDSWQ